ncbi:MAG: hypothetical protein COY74_03495, partial [Nitrosopumilales archaeon CG_4_10_14_0_8_um_filter_34_8]
QIPVLIVK